MPSQKCIITFGNIHQMKAQRSHLGYRKVYNWLIKYVVLLFICTLFGLCSLYMYFFYSQGPEEGIAFTLPNKVLRANEPIFNGKKYVHLDLKGAPPKISYYQYFFPLLIKAGANGVVIEYEDMFPFEGNYLKNISASNAYTKMDIKYINDLAKSVGLEIIPLIQTFAHLEYVLKLPEFKHLREVPEFPQMICPSNKKSMQLITQMLTQVIEAHPNSKIIHIGADETRYLGRCRACMKRIKTQNTSKEDLYMKHIANILDFIEQKYPKISVLMWDDQIRYLSEEEMQFGLNGSRVTPVVWQYENDVFNSLGSSLWNQYARFFPKIWIASAFKGAAGVDQYVVNVAFYTQNHRSWISVLEHYKYLVNFEAIILTGWQRYDHFSVLCELLPAALPSLIINLKILTANEDNHLGPPKEVSEILKCKQPYALMGPTFGTPKCSFPGSDILENVYRLHQLNEDFEQLKKIPEIKGWMNAFNSYYNFSNPEQILKISAQLNHFKSEIDEIEIEISRSLLEVYDIFTKDEWLISYVSPLKTKISELLAIKRRILDQSVWPRRPFNFKASTAQTV